MVAFDLKTSIISCKEVEDSCSIRRVTLRRCCCLRESWRMTIRDSLDRLLKLCVKSEEFSMEWG